LKILYFLFAAAADRRRRWSQLVGAPPPSPTVKKHPARRHRLIKTGADDYVK